MRAIGLCLVTSAILWSLAVWCVMWVSTQVHLSHFAASKHHLGVSLVTIVVAAGAAGFWTKRLAAD